MKVHSRGVLLLAFSLLLGLACVAPSAQAQADSDVTGALMEAVHAYARKDLAAALAIVEQVRDQLLAEMDEGPSDEEQRALDRFSNSSELLGLLGYYATYVYGSRPELDGVYELLVRYLSMVDQANHQMPRPTMLGKLDLSYDPFNNLVREIGDLEIEYDPFTRRIRELGPFEIDYDPFRGLPLEIGGIELEWDPLSRQLREVADVDVD